MRVGVKGVVAVTVGAAVLAAAVWLAVRWEGEVPAVSFPAEVRAVGPATPWAFVAEDRKSGLRELRAWVRQGERTTPLLAEDYPSGGTHRREVRLTLEAKKLGLAEGPATLVVAARDRSLKGFSGNSVFREVPVAVDTVAPRIELLSAQTYVARGGAALAAYRLSEEPAATHVEAAGVSYPGFPEKAGGAGAFVALYAVPHDVEGAPKVALVARDAAGNEARAAVPVNFLEKPLRADTLEISDRFLEAKVPEFRAADPALPADPVAAFLAVNREWRARDHARIREITASSAPERLWRGAFLQMPNTKNMAGWAERRTYVHGGARIDGQTHLGIDLASTAGAPVPAANAGTVAFAGDLGIYGGCVVVDHGQGLFTLYGHLSSIRVEKGQRVERGDPVGASGRTGMAGGDHLHFSVLVGPTFVNPAEWLDAHWIADNVENKLAIFAGR